MPISGLASLLLKVTDCQVGMHACSFCIAFPDGAIDGHAGYVHLPHLQLYTAAHDHPDRVSLYSHPINLANLMQIDCLAQLLQYSMHENLQATWEVLY